MAETIGSLIDKMSIVDLKIYHMQEQVDRVDVSTDHRESCRRRVDIMKTQKTDLAAELNVLVEDVLSGKKTLKVYRQFKMYNDPAYRSKTA
jgi:hypoxanthine-guanine phosphoribosyltransferase